MTDASSLAGRSRGSSLQTRLILGVVLLIVLCMGAAIFAARVFGNRVAEQSIDSALSQSQSVQARFVQMQLDRLGEQASWFAQDPDIVSYVQEAVDSNSTASLLDLLAEYQQDLGFDVALVLDPDGFLLARTDQPEADPVDMGEDALVEVAFDEGSSSGFWLDGGVLHTAVAAPLTQQFDLIGYLVMAERLDRGFAAEVKRLSSADIAYLIEADGGLSAVASTLEPAENPRLLSQVRSVGGLDTVLRGGGAVELEVFDDVYSGLVVPLRNAADERLGATVALASRRDRTAGVTSLLRVLTAVGLISLLFGLGLAVLLSRRLLQPVRTLADAAEAARDGNYEVAFEASGGDEVGRLSRSFDGLLGQLRAEKELQAFVGELSRNLPEPGEVEASPDAAATIEDVTIAAVDLRHAFTGGGLDDAAGLTRRLEGDIGRVEQYSRAHDGRLICLLGHRVYFAFEGSSGPARALVAVSDALEALGRATSAFHDAQPVMGAITLGRMLIGPMSIGGRRQLTVAGPTLQQLDSLLREAAPGDLVLSRRVREAVGEELVGARVDVFEREGLLSTQQRFLVNSEAVSRDLKPLLLDSDGGVSVTDTTLVLRDDGTPRQGPVRSVTLLDSGALVAGRFEILSVLGMGGMGVVYKARDRELGDLVALKALLPSLLEGSTYGSGVVEQLKDELKLARKVTHRNVLRTHDFVVSEGRPYISMEYVRGITLRTMLERSGSIPRSAALHLLRQLCEGLEAAHQQRVLHGDIKPENIILEPDGHAKLMDFGIARPLSGRSSDDGNVLGTPYYMSPEQITAGQTDARSDIYSCGVVAYELLVGRLPFLGSSAKEVFQKHITESPPTPSEVVSDFPAQLEAILLRCLAKDPSQRFDSAGALEQAFEQNF